MPRNRSEVDPAAHLPEAIRAYVYMVARKDQLPEGSRRRSDAVTALLAHWDNEMSYEECLAFSCLPKDERITMFLETKRLMEDGKLP